MAIIAKYVNGIRVSILSVSMRCLTSSRTEKEMKLAFVKNCISKNQSGNKILWSLSLQTFIPSFWFLNNFQAMIDVGQKVNCNKAIWTFCSCNTTKSYWDENSISCFVIVIYSHFLWNGSFCRFRTGFKICPDGHLS